MQHDHPIDRRRAGQIMLSAAALASLPSVSLAQPLGKKDKDKEDKNKKQPTNTRQPAAPPAVDITRLMTIDNSKDWTLQGEVNLNAWVEAPRNKDQNYTVHEFVFDSGSVVFPVLRGSASHKVYDQELKSKLRFNDAVISEAPGELVDRGYPCGTRLGRWDLVPPDGKQFRGRSVKLDVDISMTCYRTKFNEELANNVPWPQRWGPVGQTTFTDLQRVGDVSLIDHTSEGIQSLVRQWCNDKDPKSQPPVVLAKWLASNVLEYIQPSGEGLRFSDKGMLEGFDLQGSEKTLATKRGTDQDIVCALAAVYRAAGIPARIVIGFDVVDDKGGKESFLKRQRDVASFRSWVEFSLYDESTRKEIWIPVDVTRQRKKSSRVIRNQKAWQFFGNNDELDWVCPIAFQFHPPTSVIAHGSVCFWGWVTVSRDAQEPPRAEQHLRFNSISTPRTKNTDKNRRDAEERPTTPPKK
jgi:hypothetical protein